MPTTTPKPPVMPDSNVPVIDPTTGLMRVEWYDWFKFWDRIWKQLRLEIP